MFLCIVALNIYIFLAQTQKKSPKGWYSLVHAWNWFDLSSSWADQGRLFVDNSQQQQPLQPTSTAVWKEVSYCMSKWSFPHVQAWMILFWSWIMFLLHVLDTGSHAKLRLVEMITSDEQQLSHSAWAFLSLAGCTGHIRSRWLKQWQEVGPCWVVHYSSGSSKVCKFSFQVWVCVCWCQKSLHCCVASASLGPMSPTFASLGLTAIALPTASCLPTGGTEYGHVAHGLVEGKVPNFWTFEHFLSYFLILTSLCSTDLSPNEISLKKALALLQSIESMLAHDAKAGE